MPTDYAIKDGRTVFDATLYTGNGSTQSVTNAGKFQPDLVWIKDRSFTHWHALADSNRGAGKTMFSNDVGAEASSGLITAFNSNGFSVNASINGSANTTVNTNGDSLVAWQWQAGQGTNVTNTSGSITSTVSANTAAGFSIVTHTGTGASGSIGHGLGVAPKFVISKARNSSSWNWLVNIGPITGTQGDYLYLNSTQQKLNSANMLNPTSTTLPVATSPENNGSGTTYVTYCWAEVAGFSKFGSYTGNASTDGPFVYTGFRPKYVLIKNTVNGATDWTILDGARNTYNVANSELNADISAAEYTANAVDFLSNGFKIRGTYGNTNGSGQTMIFACFAENPFKYANAK